MMRTRRALDVKVEGDGPQLLFFVHGWPDDGSLWDDVVAHYLQAGGYRCARVTMPLYGKSDWATPLVSRWPSLGFGIDGIADLLHEAVASAMMAGDDGEGEAAPKPILIAHDWGSVYGFWLIAKYPELCGRLVTLDIGYLDAGVLGRVAEGSISNVHFFGKAYQYYIIALWLLQLVPVLGHLIRLIFHVGHIGGPRHEINPASCYSYWTFQVGPRLERLCQRLLGRGFAGYPEWARATDTDSFPKVPAELWPT